MVAMLAAVLVVFAPGRSEGPVRLDPVRLALATAAPAPAPASALTARPFWSGVAASLVTDALIMGPVVVLALNARDQSSALALIPIGLLASAVDVILKPILVALTAAAVGSQELYGPVLKWAWVGELASLAVAGAAWLFKATFLLPVALATNVVLVPTLTALAYQPAGAAVPVLKLRF